MLLPSFHLSISSLTVHHTVKKETPILPRLPNTFSLVIFAYKMRDASSFFLYPPPAFVRSYSTTTTQREGKKGGGRREPNYKEEKQYHDAPAELSSSSSSSLSLFRLSLLCPAEEEEEEREGGEGEEKCNKPLLDAEQYCKVARAGPSDKGWYKQFGYNHLQHQSIGQLPVSLPQTGIRPLFV